ncbi:MAG: hypothetical protein JSU66_17010 [Deltaproteobacteria bacterium]|nr:MAG: hypothetical protein JSU66_17010 [Deltaproteobacteria bacterium]
MDFRARSVWSHLPPALLLVATLAVAGFLAWASDRGIDFEDHSMMLMEARFPEEVRHNFTAGHIYSGALFEATGYDIVALRLCGLLLMLAAASVFAWGGVRLLRPLYRNAPRPAWARAEIISAGVLGTLLYYQSLMMDPGYNLYNAFAMTAAAGFLLLGLCGTESSREAVPRSSVALCLSGLCVGIALFVKISTGILLLGVLPLVLLAWPGAPRQRWTRALALLVGVGIWCAIHFAVLQSPTDFRNMMASDSSLPGGLQAAYAPRRLIALAFHNLVDLHRQIARDFAPIYVVTAGALILHARLARRVRLPRALPALVMAAACLGLAWKAYAVGLSQGGWVGDAIGVTRFHLSWIYLMLILLAARGRAARIDPLADARPDALRRSALVALLLAALPFLAAAGTTNPITMNAALGLGPWLLLCAFLILVTARLYEAGWVRDLAVVLVVAFTAVQIVSGATLRPYFGYHLFGRPGATLLDQTVPTEVGNPASVLLLDPPTSAFVRRFREAALRHGFQAGDDILVTCALAATAVFFGSRHVGLPFSYARPRDVSMASPERLRRAFIFTRDAPCISARLESWQPYFEEHGIEFPEGYRRVESMEAVIHGERSRYELWVPARAAPRERADTRE